MSTDWWNQVSRWLAALNLLLELSWSCASTYAMTTKGIIARITIFERRPILLPRRAITKTPTAQLIIACLDWLARIPMEQIRMPIMLQCRDQPTQSGRA
jgi:hypothetical protein